MPPSSETSAFPLAVGDWPYDGELSSFPSDMKKDCLFLQYKCDMLTGWFKAVLSSYEPNELSTIEISGESGEITTSSFNTHVYTVPCIPYQHTDFNVAFPANEDLYKSLKYEI